MRNKILNAVKSEYQIVLNKQLLQYIMLKIYVYL